MTAPVSRASTLGETDRAGELAGLLELVGALSETQRAAVDVLAKEPMRTLSATDIAGKLGYRPARYGVLPITRALRGIEWTKDSPLGLVTRIAPVDRWGCAYWCLLYEIDALLNQVPSHG